MYTLSVGGPYHPERTKWDEAGVYQYRGGGHELLLFFRDPESVEVTAVRELDAEFALHVEQPVIVFLYKFGRGLVPWSDCPFSIHLVPEDERSPPPVPKPTERALLSVILVDADTGVVKALRAVTLSPAFTKALHAAIREQAALPFDEQEQQRAVKRLYRQHPTSVDLLLAPGTVQCKGGE